MKHPWIAPAVGTACLLGIVALTLLPYRGNPSALLHYGNDILAEELPAALVVLDVPSYDGAHYYRIARQLPLLFTDAGRATLRESQTVSYAYQRILLPVLAWALSLGQETSLPWAFLAINLFALLGAGAMLAKRGHHAPTILAIMLCPAAILGLHFSLAEPLTLLLLTAFFVRARGGARLKPFDVTLLSLAVLAREVNVLFAGFVLLWFLWKRRWTDALWTLIPLGVFGLWHTAIFAVFGEWPFFMSTDKRGWPLEAPWAVVTGAEPYTPYTLTSIALLLLFVLPVLAWCVTRLVRAKDTSLPVLGTIAFVAVMFCMPDHIWGSITSIGRVITPVYPCAIFALAARDTRTSRLLLCAIAALGLTLGIALALNTHPFHLA